MGDVTDTKTEAPKVKSGATKEQLEKSKNLSASIHKVLEALGITGFLGLFICDDNATRVFYHQVEPELARGFAIKIFEDIGAARERGTNAIPKDSEDDRSGKAESIPGNEETPG